MENYYDEMMKRYKEEADKQNPGNLPEDFISQVPDSIKQEFISRLSASVPEQNIPTSESPYDVNVSDTTVPMAGKVEGADQLALPRSGPSPDLTSSDLVLPEPLKEPVAPVSKAVKPEVSKLPVKEEKPVDLSAITDKQVDETPERGKRNIIPGLAAGIGDAISASASAFGGNAPGGSMERVINAQEKDLDRQKLEAEEKIKDDPNSAVSKAYRQMVAQIVPDIAKQSAFQNMSAKMIGDKLPLIDTMMKASAQKDARELAQKDLAMRKEEMSNVKETGRQDKLEKEGRDMLNKVVSTRSGGLGLEDAKVNQAIHLQTMLNNSRDPKTGEYSIPPSMHTELAIGLQRLLSPAGAGSTQLTEELRQKTAKEGLSGALIYLGFDPKKIGGTTQSVSKFFADAVKRQGLISEKNRDTYINQFKNRMPTGLSDDRKEYLVNQEIGNRFTDTLNEGKKPAKSALKNPLSEKENPLGLDL